MVDDSSPGLPSLGRPSPELPALHVESPRVESSDPAAPGGDALPDDVLLDPAMSAALIGQQRARLQQATDVDGRVLFGAWGVAWLVGFAALWTISTDAVAIDLPPGLAVLVFTLLLVTAMVITAVHIARKTAGVHGVSAVQGAMYGWAWCLSFAVMGALSYALARAEVSQEVMTTTTTVVSALIVGTLYMAGAALTRERTQFVLGVWICVVTAVAAVVGLPHILLVMSVAGGGGMIVGAVVEAARRRRVRQAPPMAFAG